MKKIIEIIKKSKRFLVSTHVGPDPDALCSEMAVAIYLKSLGKRVDVINQDKVPDRFYFLPGLKGIKTRKAVKSLDYDAAIIVDCGELSRIGSVQELIKPDKILINIDHHITNDSFGDYNLVNPAASSTGELLYELLSRAGAKLNRNMALHFYTGIMTDTGSFRYENTTTRTHQIAAELLKYQFSPSELYGSLYEMIPLKDMQLFTKVLNRMIISHKGKVVCVKLPKTIWKKFSEHFDLRDTIFKFLRSIKGLEVYVIFTEISAGETRVNLRSSGKVDVAKLAECFNGGGHKRASGCVLAGALDGSKTKVMRRLRKFL